MTRTKIEAKQVSIEIWIVCEMSALNLTTDAKSRDRLHYEEGAKYDITSYTTGNLYWRQSFSNYHVKIAISILKIYNIEVKATLVCNITIWLSVFAAWNKTQRLDNLHSK